MFVSDQSTKEMIAAASGSRRNFPVKPVKQGGYTPASTMVLKALVSLWLILFAVAQAAAQGASPSTPTLSPRVTGGRGQPFAALATQPPGYMEEERFLSGTSRLVGDLAEQ